MGPELSSCWSLPGFPQPPQSSDTPGSVKVIPKGVRRGPKCKGVGQEDPQADLERGGPMGDAVSLGLGRLPLKTVVGLCIHFRKAMSQDKDCDKDG